MHIGLVDDNPAILEFMTAVLEMEGHTISTYIDGVKFLQTLPSESESHADFPFDLLILDLWLPGDVSGLDIIKALRRTPVTQHLPILLISGAGQKALEPIREQFPYIPILRKPFALDALIEAIEQF